MNEQRNVGEKRKKGRGKKVEKSKKEGGREGREKQKEGKEE